MKRCAGRQKSDGEGGSKSARTSGSRDVFEAPAPPPGYWVSQKQSQKQSAAEATTTDTFDIVRTRFMRRKLEYLLNQCADHKEGCRGCTPLSNVHVVEVSRIENHPLWERFAVAQATQREQHGQVWAEKSRPIKCDVGREDERFLFHGTSPLAVSQIAAEGFKIKRAWGKLYPRWVPVSRYGQGIYFTDQSCKAHQYSDQEFVLQEDGSKLYCMLYCRVSTKNSLDFKVTDDVRQTGYLQGMKKPKPSDKVFRQRLPEVQQAFDSLVVAPCQTLQIHREVVVFDTDQVYPEYVVWYKVLASTDAQTLQTAGLGGIGGSNSSTVAAAPSGADGKICPALAAPQTRLLESTPEPAEREKSPECIEDCRADAFKYFAINCAKRKREGGRKERMSEERERKERAREKAREKAKRARETKIEHVQPQCALSASTCAPTARPARAPTTRPPRTGKRTDKRPDFYHLNMQLMQQKARNPKPS